MRSSVRSRDRRSAREGKYLLAVILKARDARKRSKQSKKGLAAVPVPSPHVGATIGLIYKAW